MIIEKKRLMKMFYYLIDTEGIVKAKDLAEYAEVSERTVKNDLEDLKNLAQASGCLLHSKKGQGHWIEIVDPECFEPVREQLYFQFSELNYTKEYETRANDIARRLLVQDDYIKLDDIADEMFLSRSSIKNSLREVRQILEAFKLELISKPGYGVKVQGPEINIRFCMLELFINHHSSSVTFLEDSEYLSYFETDLKIVGEIRQVLLKTLRESETRVFDHYTHRIVRYLSMMNNRFKRGYRLHISSETKKVLNSLSEYDTARRILENERQVFTDMTNDEDEIYGLEILILLWSDITSDIDLENRYPMFADTEQLVEELLEYLKELWHIDFTQSKSLKRALIANLIPFYFRVYFKTISYKLIGRHVENNMISSSPASVALARSAAVFIQMKTGIQMSGIEILDLALHLYYAIDKIQYDYKPKRVIISAQSGYQSCKVIKDKMIRKFGAEAFACIDVIEFYEARKLKSSEYDLMVMNFAPYYYRYDFPMVYVDCIPNAKQMNQVYTQAILSSYQLEPLLRKLKLSGDFVFNDFHYEGKKEFIRLLSYRSAGSSELVGALEKELSMTSDICVWNEVVFLMCNQALTGKNCFEIYSFIKPGIWDKKSIRAAIFISVDYAQDKQLLRFVEQFTHELAAEPENLERLIHTKSVYQILEIVKNGLRSG